MKKMVILNITHGDHPYCTKNGFLPIAAGACRNDILNDACGEDNISHKNRYYGDLTSIYWAWKNLREIDIIGTSHYRRYISDIAYLPEVEYSVDWESFNSYHYKTNNFKRLLKKYDFIMVRTLCLEETIGQQYIACHPYPENLKIVDDVLSEIYPDYTIYWRQYLESNNLQYGFLFMTKWVHFDGLCSWLFPILEAVEARIDCSKYEGYQSRVIAYLYERLVPVYIYKNNLSIFHMPMFIVSEEGVSIKTHIDNYYISMMNKYTYRFIKKIRNLLKL